VSSIATVQYHGTVVVTCPGFTDDRCDVVASNCILGVVSHRYQYLVTRLVKVVHGDNGVVAGHAGYPPVQLHLSNCFDHPDLVLRAGGEVV